MTGPFPPPSSGGGGSDGWTGLVFSGSPTTIFGLTAYEATASFPLAAGQHLDVDGFAYKNSGHNGGFIVSIDGSTGFIIANGGGGGCFVDNYSGGFNGVISGSAVEWQGLHAATLAVNAMSTNSSYVYGQVDGTPMAAGHDTTIDLIGTVRVYVVTDNVALCAGRARVVTNTMFTS